MERRSTKQRDLVYETLLQLYHPTADEVFERIRVLHPGVGRATVFRNLTVLAQQGRIARLAFPGDGVRYDPIVDGHSHFACRRCGKIIDFPPVSALPLPQTDDCLIEDYSVKYYGVCRECNSQ
ncbi:MAG: transcriptional repressor [Clostridia bacterium]|nr:transcriptional repressor [Clostridia bacterium]